jgi:hypothetical protein
MPIRPENKARYPKNWKEIRAQILERANNRCEMCGVENHSEYIRKKDGKVCKHVLTIAHIHDDAPENCDPSNLMALCCFCHNGLDAKMMAEVMKKIFLLTLTALVMVGCDYNSNRIIDTKTEGILYGTIIIDSCEYIRGSDKLAHKGNCRFCKERREKELKELAIKLKEK